MDFWDNSKKHEIGLYLIPIVEKYNTGGSRYYDFSRQFGKITMFADTKYFKLKKADVTSEQTLWKSLDDILPSNWIEDEYFLVFIYERDWWSGPKYHDFKVPDTGVTESIKIKGMSDENEYYFKGVRYFVNGHAQACQTDNNSIKSTAGSYIKWNGWTN